MYGVVLSFLSLYQHIFYIHLHGFPYLLLEHHIDQPLVGGPSIEQSEGHPYVEVQSPLCDKGCMFLVRTIHEYLIVS